MFKFFLPAMTAFTFLAADAAPANAQVVVMPGYSSSSYYGGSAPYTNGGYLPFSSSGYSPYAYGGSGLMIGNGGIGTYPAALEYGYPSYGYNSYSGSAYRSNYGAGYGNSNYGYRSGYRGGWRR